MITGFTGTSTGMSAAQKRSVVEWLLANQPDEVHHGDCVGADAQFHDLVRQHLPEARVIIHPPTDPKARAWKDGDIVWNQKPYLVRNHDIVDACEILIATPKEHTEILRSGTWATYRYAKLKGVETRLILP